MKRKARPPTIDSSSTARKRAFHPEAALPLTHVAYHMLLALVTQQRHGYGIIKYIEERTSGAVALEAGTLYAAIKRMKQEGWIEGVTAVDEADSRRRNYRITELGRDVSGSRMPTPGGHGHPGSRRQGLAKQTAGQGIGL